MEAVERSTKSAIAGKQSDSFGQTTATGGVPQSSPCVQPSKLIKLQEMEKKNVAQKRASNRDPCVPAA